MNDIAEFMSRHHARLDAIFDKYRRESNVEKAKELFPRFDSSLRAHIGWEEEILFPPFEEKTGMGDSGPTAVMRLEHRQIKQLLQSIGERLEGHGEEDPSASLERLLAAHNHKEEQVLYPWLDQVLAEEERSALLDRIRQTPEGGEADR